MSTRPASPTRYSVAMTDDTARALRTHLIRADGQEDLCIALYRVSTGATRQSALIADIVLPKPGEREVHGNASFTGDYVLRALELAAETGSGIAILHSHPNASGWQAMSYADHDAERAYANLAREISGLPLVGVTLAGGSGTWSARSWARGAGAEVDAVHCESVRVVGAQLTVDWNPDVRPMPPSEPTQIRTVASWGPRAQADITRLRVLVIGAGTLGEDIALRLAATGIKTVGVMDFDTFKLLNLDRMIGPTALDAWLHSSKLEVLERLLRESATARGFEPVMIEGSICEPEQFSKALDYDVIFCCIDDHPWPRSVVNMIAYSDLIPVIDGGVHIDAFPDGAGMRNATWRSHVLRPGRPCMACNGQLDLGKVHVDADGLLDDEEYISGLPPSERPQSQNVAALAIGAAAAYLAQFVSFVTAPGGLGEPGPLRFSLSTHWLEHMQVTSREHCPVERNALVGDRRQVLLRHHRGARAEIARRRHAQRRPAQLVGRLFVRGLRRLLEAARVWASKQVISSEVERSE
jgi:hypothetical protein